MTPCYVHPLTVPFYDVDPMGVVWHGNYVKYFEEARCGLLRSIGTNYAALTDEDILLPVVSLEIKYMRPCLFGQELAIEVSADQDNVNFLVLHYLVRDQATGERLCKATTRQAAVDNATKKLLFEIPASLRERLADRIFQTMNGENAINTVGPDRRAGRLPASP